MSRVVIGMDPHKRSATIEVLDEREQVLQVGRTPTLRQVTVDDNLVALRLLVDRRDELGAARTDTVNRLHRLLLELLPGGAKKFLSAPQARACWPRSDPATL